MDAIITPDLLALATRQTATIMFATLGLYQGNPQRLLDALSAAVDLAATNSAAADDKLKTLLGPGGAQVAQPFTSYRLHELPRTFIHLRDKLLADLEHAYDDLQASRVEPEQFYVNELRDERTADPNGPSLDDLPEGHRQVYEVEMTRPRSRETIYIDVQEKGVPQADLPGTCQLALALSIRLGRPHVLIMNERYGNQGLYVFATPDGFYVHPSTSKLNIVTGVPLEGTGLAQLDAELNPPGSPRHIGTAFIDTSKSS